MYLGSELAVVLEEEAVGGVGVDREPPVREESGQQMRVAREDHGIAVAVGNQHREIDCSDPLQQ